MDHSLNNIRRIMKVVRKNVKNGNNDWYNGLDFEQVSCLYRFAKGGYLTSGAKSFGYIDSCSLCHYIRVELLAKYLGMLSQTEGIEAARSEFSHLQRRGFVHFSILNSQNVICTSEGLTQVERMTQGIYPENAKQL